MSLPSPKARRAASAALAVAALALVRLGARGPHSEDSPDHHCKDDLEYVFAACKDGPLARSCGETVHEEFVDACEAACVMVWCPEEAACTELDPMWCAPCDDMHGALFWRNAEGAEGRCNQEFYVRGQKHDEKAFYSCWRADMERHCPALVSTDWDARIDTILLHPPTL
jgi:hypothetical protein